ncbi:hypothetical protein [Erwinia sp.]|uniref:hypothetical protein n=1 Tax=Erwinia citreus TaxID=558 RepID=UPI00289875A3|nr:hypothetical protein [Erwinia sp.]
MMKAPATGNVDDDRITLQAQARLAAGMNERWTKIGCTEIKHFLFHDIMLDMQARKSGLFYFLSPFC